MLRRAHGAVAAAIAGQARSHHFPMTKPPIEIEYLDSDPMDYAIRQEAREWGFDDLYYMRELAFVRIYDNPNLTVGEFRNMTPEERKKMFWGSNRQDFYRWFVWKTCGKKEHLYHKGWDNQD